MRIIAIMASVLLTTAGVTVTIAALVELTRCLQEGGRDAAGYVVLVGCGVGIFVCGLLVLRAS